MARCVTTLLRRHEVPFSKFPQGPFRPEGGILLGLSRTCLAEFLAAPSVFFSDRVRADGQNLRHREARIGAPRGGSANISGRVAGSLGSGSISRTEVDQWLEGRDRERSVGKHIQYEGLFLDDFVLRNVADYLVKTCPQFDKRQRCEALLTESTLAQKEELASASPASYQKHLFTKEVGTPLDTIVDLWWSASKKLPVSQSCPDWALRDPSPYRVVFEAKFFRRAFQFRTRRTRQRDISMLLLSRTAQD